MWLACFKEVGCSLCGEKMARKKRFQVEPSRSLHTGWHVWPVISFNKLKEIPYVYARNHASFRVLSGAEKI